MQTQKENTRKNAVIQPDGSYGGQQKTSDGFFSQAKYRHERLKGYTNDGQVKAEMLLLSCSVQSNKAAEYVKENGLDFIFDEPSKELILIAANSKEKIDVAKELLNIKGDATQLLASINEAIPYSDPYAEVVDCIEKLKSKRVQEKRLELARKYDEKQLTAEEYRKALDEL